MANEKANISINKLIAQIEKLLNNLPESERKNAILAIENKIYNWNKILAALKKKDALANKIALKLRELLE